MGRQWYIDEMKMWAWSFKFWASDIPVAGHMDRGLVLRGILRASRALERVADMMRKELRHA